MLSFHRYDMVKSLCDEKGYHFISNDNISREHLYKDGVHLLDNGTDILAGNFVNFINYFILHNDIAD